MLKKTMTYTDFNDEEREEDLYFHFSKAELAEMELEYKGGLSNLLEKIIQTKDTPQLIKIFKRLILDAYGEKSPDGRRFIKSQELRDSFEQTNAYSDLFMELGTNAESAAAFVNAVIPKIDDLNVQQNQQHIK